MRRPAAAAVVALALVLCAGARADLPLSASTPVREWAGTAVLSVEQGSVFRLATQRAQSAPRVLPGIAASPQAFDADIGPGPDGSPVIVFARCREARRCRLMQTTTSGRSEAPIAGSAGLHGFEYAPSVWGDRLVFARRLANGPVHVYERPLDGGGRSVMLPDPPAPQCPPYAAKPYCAGVEGLEVDELDIRGRLVAETLALGIGRSQELCPSTEVRLVDVGTHRSRRISTTECGLGGETLIGASVTPGRVMWARICPGDPSGCGGNYTQLFSYGLRSQRVEHAAQSNLAVAFAAEEDGHSIEVAAPETEGEGNCEKESYPGIQPVCRLVRLGRIPFVPLRRRPPLVGALAVRDESWR